MKLRVLLAVDEPALRARLSRALQAWGHAIVLGATDPREPLDAHSPAAAIVAQASGGAGRLALVRKLCAAGGRVIVIAGSRAEIPDLARSLPDAEAFLPLPLDEQRLAALLEQIAASSAPEAGAASPGPAAVLRFGGCALDLAGRTFADDKGREVALTRAELDLLAQLARCSGRVQSRDQLRNAISGRDRYSNDRSIDMLVTRLRRKIDAGGRGPRLIVTVTGAGYKLGVPVERVASATPRPAGSPPMEADDPPGPGSLRQLTVLACGIGGLAALSARLGAEDEAELTHAVHRSCAGVALRFRGVLAKTLGASVVIYFGCEQAQEHDPERAVRAGLELVDALRSMDGPGPLDAHIGIATGEMMVDAAPGGSGKHSAVGQPLNLALSLRSAAAPGSILITGSTRELVGDFFDYREMAPLELARDVAPVPVWQVVGENACSGRFDALRRADMLELVGRRQEMDLLQHCWSRALAGAGQVVLVTGEPGIGKSRLLAEFQDESNVRLYGSLKYFGSQLQTDTAFQPVIGELQRAAGFDAADAPSARLAKLAALLHGPCRAQDDVALIAGLLSLPAPDAPALRELSPQMRKRRTLEALVARVRNLASRQPVLVAVEDAHWLDPTSLEYLSQLAEMIPRLPVMLLIAARREFHPPWLVYAPMTCITLARLGPDDARLLVDRIVHGKTLPREVVKQILAQTDGVPLFIEELTKSLLEDGFLREGPDGWEMIRPYPSQTIPKTLLGLLSARLDRLGPAKEIAQTGAVIGREFSHELLAAVSTASESGLEDALEALIASELVLRHGSGADAVYVFKHALVQDAASASLLREHKRVLHRRIAEELERRFPGIAETQPEVPAQHFTEAGLIEKAADLWGKAGLQSLQRSALMEATAQLGRALAQIATLASTARLRRQQIAFQVALANALMHTRGYASPDTKASFAQARRYIEEAEALGEPPDDPLLLFAVIYGFWVGNFVAFNGPLLRRLAAQFLALAEKQGAAVPLMIGHRLMGTSLKCTGDVAASRAHYDRALALYDPALHRPLATRFGQDIGVVLLSYRAWTLWLLGFPEAARADADRALEDAREIGQAATSMYALAHAARTSLWTGDWATAGALAEETLALAEEKGASAWKAFGTMHRGSVLALTGRAADAVPLLTAGIDAWRSTGSTLWVPCYLSNLALAHAELGRLDDARRCIGEAASAAETTDATWCGPEVHRIAGEIARLSPGHDPAKAQASFERALAIARAQQARSWELRAAASLARLWRDQGRRHAARELLAPVYGWFGEGFETVDLREAGALLDELAS
jgi:class 3 adenylate cyclase/DNA-binding response OmpR family regulator/predicted ATPase